MRPKWSAFINYYVQCWNAAQAAREAGYSEHSAHKQGYKLLQRPEIQEAIKVKIDELAMSADEAILKISEIARSADADRDKLAALKLMTQIHQMLTEKFDITATVQAGEVNVNEWLTRISRKDE